MNLTNLSPLGLVLGALALAVVTFVLQILRVRHREQRVVTTMFWRQALQEERVRVFRERFRHPLAWLLVTAIAVLTWFAYARPEIDHDPETEALILVDGSAMRTADELRRDLVTAAEIARGLEDDARRVFVVTSSARCLLDAAEPVALLDERARAMAPAATLNSIDRVLPALVGPGDRPLRVYLVGRITPGSETLETVRAARPDVEWLRVPGLRGTPAPDPTPGAEILGFGVDPWLGVLATLRGVEPSAVQLKLDGQVLALAPVAEVFDIDGAGQLLELSWTDLPAESGRLELTASGLTAVASWPGRGTTTVALVFDRAGSATEQAFRQAVESEPTLVLTTDRAAADVTVGDVADADLRVVGPDGGSGDPRSTFHFDGLGPSQLARIVARTGLSDLDADALATTLGRPVTVGADESGERRVTIDRAVFDGQGRLAESRVFPVLVRESVHWLADRPVVLQRAAVGEPIGELAGHQVARVATGGSEDLQRVDTLGRPFVPAMAGTYRTSGGQVFEVSLQSPLAAVSGLAGSEANPIEVVEPPTLGPALGLDRWLILIVLALGVFEWISVRRGRMP